VGKLGEGRGGSVGFLMKRKEEEKEQKILAAARAR